MNIGICLWYHGRAEEAAEFYTGLIKDSRIVHKMVSPADNPSADKGEVLLMSFELGGVPFTALNGGPQFVHTEAASIELHCDSQEEVDRYWDGLVEGGGQHSQCGWLKDRFGVSWQVIPNEMGQYVGGPDPAGRERAMLAMMEMTKLDVAALKRAYEGA